MSWHMHSMHKSALISRLCFAMLKLIQLSSLIKLSTCTFCWVCSIHCMVINEEKVPTATSMGWMIYFKYDAKELYQSTHQSVLWVFKCSLSSTQHKSMTTGMITLLLVIVMGRLKLYVTGCCILGLWMDHLLICSWYSSGIWHVNCRILHSSNSRMIIGQHSLMHSKFSSNILKWTNLVTNPNMQDIFFANPLKPSICPVLTLSLYF